MAANRRAPKKLKTATPAVISLNSDDEGNGACGRCSAPNAVASAAAPATPTPAVTQQLVATVTPPMESLDLTVESIKGSSSSINAAHDIRHFFTKRSDPEARRTCIICRDKLAINPDALPAGTKIDYSFSTSSGIIHKHLETYHKDEYLHMCTANGWKNLLPSTVKEAASHINILTVQKQLTASMVTLSGLCDDFSEDKVNEQLMCFIVATDQSESNVQPQKSDRTSDRTGTPIGATMSNPKKDRRGQEGREGQTPRGGEPRAAPPPQPPDPSQPATSPTTHANAANAANHPTGQNRNASAPTTRQRHTPDRRHVTTTCDAHPAPRLNDALTACTHTNTISPTTGAMTVSPPGMTSSATSHTRCPASRMETARTAPMLTACLQRCGKQQLILLPGHQQCDEGTPLTAATSLQRPTPGHQQCDDGAQLTAATSP
ncbi:hypothetical protein DXG01_016261 [Tephrocybe rancida]|nr:hypothetical protein DXG01_016261 [Tephrocybe rancida]